MANEIVLRKQDSAEMEELARQELRETLGKFPRVTIGQGSPGKGKKLGHFNFESGECFERLSGVTFVFSHASNVLFRGQLSKKKDAACASDDAVRPAERIANPINNSCLTCPARQWSSGNSPEEEFNTKFKKDLSVQLGYSSFEAHKPLCTYNENLVFFDSDGSLFELQVAKHNTDALKKLKMVVNAMMIKKRVPAVALKIDLWLTPIDGNGNRYLLNFSKSDDWSVVDIEIVRDRTFLASVVKKEAPKIMAAKHEATDAAHQRQEREAAPVSDDPWPSQPNIHDFPDEETGEKLPF